MKKKKIILLTSSFQDQDSVRTIVENLIACYKRDPSCSVYVHNCESGSIDQKKLALPTNLIIVHPLVVLNESFKHIIHSMPLEVKIRFHIFGDFVRKSNFFLKLNSLLVGRNVQFITASHAYKTLVDRSLDGVRSEIFRFPINEKTFFYSESARKKFRKNHNLTDTDKVFIYTGRLSPQKNILLLLQVFSKLHKKNKDVKLILIGNIDDFEAPTFFEKNYIAGEYFSELSTFIKTNNVPNITFLPRLNHKLLNHAYNGADYYINLSLYHDEDYGYSPIEALFTGCPVILSSWGGFKDLKPITALKNGIFYNKVSFSGNELNVSVQGLVKKCQEALETKKINRAHNAKKTSAQYGLAASGQKLKKIPESNTVFRGFSEKYAALTLQMNGDQSVDINLYRYFYQSFWKNK